MRAADHTARLLTWWRRHGIDRLDLAVRFPSGAWAAHHDLPLPAAEHLAWARAGNARRRADVYVRPARGAPWPHIFLDDLPVATARLLAARHRGMLVHTSPHGGCHLHIICDRPCTHAERHHLQRRLADRHGADPRATAGAQFQRLPGMRNWKRGGVWVNADSPEDHAPPLPVDPLLTTTDPVSQHTPEPTLRCIGVDRSPSGRDWASVCRRLEQGHRDDDIIADLVHASAERRGSDALRYAKRTVVNAASHINR